LRFEFVASQKQSTLGGLPAVESLAQEFGLWDKIRALPNLDPRVHTTHGYSPSSCWENQKRLSGEEQAFSFNC